MSCATTLWDLLLKAFPPRPPQVVAGLIAAAAGNIMRGPNHAAGADLAKAFKHWDAAVANLLQVGDVTLTPKWCTAELGRLPGRRCAWLRMRFGRE